MNVVIVVDNECLKNESQIDKTKIMCFTGRNYEFYMQ